MMAKDLGSQLDKSGPKTCLSPSALSPSAKWRSYILPPQDGGEDAIGVDVAPSSNDSVSSICLV